MDDVNLNAPMRETNTFRCIKTDWQTEAYYGASEGVRDEWKLQQKFIDTATGAWEWRDVPIVEG